jgi:hypothetical protein
MGGIELKAQAALCSTKSKKKRSFIYEVPRDESQVSVGGWVSLGYGSKGRLR